MKLLVFAHTPPPHHGQSYMVQQMLEGFGGDRRKKSDQDAKGNYYGIECYHVNARLSRSIDDIGGFQLRKLFLIVWYCLEAIWCRFRYGISAFYYVPAPGQRAAVYRDWLVMILCRPFFKRIIFHWHAAGLMEWVDTSAPGFARPITRVLLGQPEVSIVLSHYNIGDAGRLCSRQWRVVPNGIPDPCPEFAATLLPRRVARTEAQIKLGRGLGVDAEERLSPDAEIRTIKLLYLAHCSREKGLFDAIEAVALANGQLTDEGSLLRYRLNVAGEFVYRHERVEFEKRIEKPDLRLNWPQEVTSASEKIRGPAFKASPAVYYLGFLSGGAKHRALAESDCLCFPTYFHAESFGLVIIEAMAFGLPIVTTRWRSIPELFPKDYPGLVPIQSPAEIVEALRATLAYPPSVALRKLFEEKYTLKSHLTQLAAALHREEEGN